MPDFLRMHEVKSEDDKRLFLDMPLQFYRNDPAYIRPLDKDIEQVFNPRNNKFYKNGACRRWILIDERGAAIGRIAAFVNKKYRQEQPTGGIGFFECIDDSNASAFMFDHCIEWLKEQGMEAVDGPINFGERDRWWGLLTDGFSEPLYCMNYNPAYYRRLWEQYGFQVYFNQICFGMKVNDPLQEKFFARHAELSKDQNFSVRHANKSRLEDFARDFSTVYNKAWASHGENKQVDERSVKMVFEMMKQVLDEQIIWFAYYKDEPVAMWVNIPDLNQYFKYLNGKWGPLQKLRLLWLKAFGVCRRFVGLVFGVIPEFQGRGVDAYLIVEAATVIRRKSKYIDFEMQWIGDFNPKMMNVAQSLGAKPTRNLVTYRYLFNRGKAFKRHPII